MSKTAAGVMDAPEKKATKQRKAPAKKPSKRRGTRNTEAATVKKAAERRTKSLARRGEDAAAQYLVKRGYEILERNWECFAGTADIIARDGDILVFAEVKTRNDLEYGFPSEAVTKEKRQRYEKIACTYVAEHEFSDMLMRFDVLALTVIDTDRAIIRHHINAFCAGEVA